jgi:hypothetical protein
MNSVSTATKEALARGAQIGEASLVGNQRMYFICARSDYGPVRARGLTKDGHRLLAAFVFPRQPGRMERVIDAPISFPHLRRTATRPCRRDIRVSGWVHRKRDHGGVLFVDLRDHYGMVQIVADSDSPALPVLESLRAESVVTIDGKVKARAEGGEPNLPTGEIEIFAPRTPRAALRAEELPLPVAASRNIPRTSACATASSTCAARRCTPTSCCARRSSPHAPAHGRYRASPNIRRRS